MSANPRWNIIGAEGDDSADRLSSVAHESDLSPELRAIADRLGNEAADLADRFPPKQLVEPRSVSIRWKIAAAVVLVAAGSGVFGWWLHGAATINRLEPSRAIADVARPDAPQAALVSLPAPEAAENPAGVQEAGYSPKAPQSSKLSEFDMLRIQLGAFEQVIRKLQEELNRRSQLQMETQRSVESLREEVANLHRQLGQRRDEASIK